MRQGRAARLRRRRRSRRPGPAAWALRIGFGLVVAALLLTNLTDNLRRSVLLLWDADLDRAFLDPSDEAPAEADALKSEVAALLSDPELIGEATGVAVTERAGFHFDGCELVLEIVMPEDACEGDVPDHRVQRVEWRHDLRNYVLHPFLQPAKIPVVSRSGGLGLKAVLSYPMVPSVVERARIAFESFLLSDPETLDSPDAATRLETLKTITTAVDAGELGLFIQQNRERTTFCDGSQVVRPVTVDRLLLVTAPNQGDRLRDRLHALGARVCPARSWLFDTGP